MPYFIDSVLACKNFRDSAEVLKFSGITETDFSLFRSPYTHTHTHTLLTAARGVKPTWT